MNSARKVKTEGRSYWRYVKVPTVVDVTLEVTFTSTVPVPGGLSQVMRSGDVNRVSLASADPKSTLNCVPDVPAGAIIVTRVPPEAGPEVGSTLPDTGRTMNSGPLLFLPITVTVTSLVLTPEGTTTLMLVSDQDLAVPASRDPNRTLLVPWIGAKLRPWISIVSPPFPTPGDSF